MWPELPAPDPPRSLTNPSATETSAAPTQSMGLSRPFRAWIYLCMLPRALPWAVIVRTFGALNSMLSSKTHETEKQTIITTETAIRPHAFKSQVQKNESPVLKKKRSSKQGYTL